MVFWATTILDRRFKRELLISEFNKQNGSPLATTYGSASYKKKAQQFSMPNQENKQKHIVVESGTYTRNRIMTVG